MDGHGNVNMTSWSFLESSPTALKGHLGLQLMSSIVDEKPLIHGASGGSVGGHQQPEQNHHHQQHPLQHQNHYGYPSLMATSTNGGLFHHHHHLVGGITEASVGIEYMRGSWLSYNKERNLNLLPNNNHHHANYGVFAESSSAHSLQMLLSSSLKNESEPLHPQLQERCEERDVDVGIFKKRGAPKLQPDKSPRAKKLKRAPKAQKDESALSVPRIRAPKKSVEVVINGISMYISGIPIPVCTCTGSPQQCYKWGSGGWQSACCTNVLSTYPLPVNSKRRGARIAGRKMSVGAFKKVLEKLASEGFNFSNPIDLRNYWAKHGTNKFVTIR
ncbi:hypothetical protein LIER_13613 [Lithospermum erythrorhizon]|uniref:GAGA-binding transcriptional activator n=1 Tax=Lithospermum erythrorhizon TaxID=34254 RepID=A0AAV3PW27_LITER